MQYIVHDSDIDSNTSIVRSLYVEGSLYMLTESTIIRSLPGEFDHVTKIPLAPG